MVDKAPRNNAHCTLPDDPEQSTYRFIIVAADVYKRQMVISWCPALPLRAPPNRLSVSVVKW